MKQDQIERRSFLKCMAWAGTGLVWAMNGGVLSADELLAERSGKPGFSFVQISDSHIGFNRDPNHDVTKTLQEAVDKINALEEQPAFVIHTGDITHLADGRAVRHCRADLEKRASESGLLCAGRARCVY